MLTNEELRAEAEAARDAGRWGMWRHWRYQDAVMDPERVLALLDEIDRLKRENCELNVTCCGLNSRVRELEGSNGER